MLLWIHSDLAYRDVMMRGDDELDVLQIGFYWKIGFLNKTLVESVEADVLQFKEDTCKQKRTMSGYAGAIPDEESLESGNRNQPFATTPMAEALKNEGGKTKQITWREILGLEDLLSLTVWRASVAELVGTAVLVFALDTIVISTIQTGTSMPNLILSTLVAIIITILLLATFPISGGHINPLITFAAFLTGLISPSKTFIYILAQCVGAIFGALALKAVVNREIQQTFSLGGCTITIVAPGPDGQSTVTGLETSQALWLEIICGFVFLFASVWMALDHRQAKGLGRVSVFIIGGIVLGLLVFVSTTVTATKGYAGAGLNPARCLGPAIVRGGHLWNGHWVFWVGPAIACMAFAVYTKIIPRQLAHTIE
ncbi:uncharacterized protein [Populus alba]|uniref:uncharacterized protein n=1 Tax=Populus alba TaxID=43335 RepID=UPI003CC74044